MIEKESSVREGKLNLLRMAGNVYDFKLPENYPEIQKEDFRSLSAPTAQN
jgi:hypothetical protein